MHSQDANALGSLLSMAAQHKGKVMVACVFSLVAQLLSIAPFVVLSFLIDRLVDDGSVHSTPVWPYVTAATLCLVFRYVFAGFAAVLSHITAYDILHDLRLAIAKKLPRLPLGFFNRKTSGQIRKVMLEDVEQMELFIGHNLPDLVGSTLLLLMTILILFWLDWRLALAAIAPLPIGFFAQALTISRNRESRSLFFTASEKMNTTMVQYIHGMPVIKAFTRTESSFNKYVDSVSECSYYEDIMCGHWALPMTLFQVAANANMLLILPLGSLLWLHGHVTISALVLVLLIGLGLGGIIQQLIMMGSFLEQQVEGRKRIDTLLFSTELPEVENPATPQDASLRVEHVSFAYEDNDILRDVNVNLEPGRFLALVGPSGAGKSTLAKLILRFWDVKNGAIRLGGADIRQVDANELMRHVSFVFQNIFLFNDTVAANLRVGKPDATQEELEAAARAARCHDFIMALPNGYEYVVGEKGGALSGGEKQRLCIARALLKNAPILVLDEATAFVDPENEADIQLALNALVHDKTLIVVAHRLSTITSADEIVVLDGGIVAARGTHVRLLAESELYRNLWQAHVASKEWRLNQKKGGDLHD